MLEAIVIFSGGLFVAEVVGVLLGLDKAVEVAETSVVNYGKKVESRTRAVCDEEAAKAVKEVARETNQKWSKAAAELQARHQTEMDSMTTCHLEEVQQAAAFGFQSCHQQLLAAGWGPQDLDEDPE